MTPNSRHQAASPRLVDVAIIGGGIAGLAAAYELSQRGISFLVLERAPRVGGVIFSEELDGFTIDGGPDALLIQKPAAIALCRDIGLGDRLVSTKPPRLAYIQRGGRLHALPAASVLGIPTRLGPFVRTTLFSIPGKLRMGAELFVPPRRDEADESIGAFMTRRFGREAAVYLAEPLLAGIHAGDVDRLSVRALFPRLVDAERSHGSLLRAFRLRSPLRNPPSAIRDEGAFKSLPQGLSEMIRALVLALGEDRIRLNDCVDAITGPGPFTVRMSSGDSIDAKAIVIATPAYATAALVRDRDQVLAALADEIPYASAATVALAFDRSQIRHPLTGSGFVVPRVEGTGILAASWLSSKWPHRAPHDRVLMRTFLGGARDPGALDRPDAELIHTSLAALTPLLGIERPPLFTRIYRWPRGNAQHEVGHLDRMAAIERALTRHPGLFITGSGFRGVGIPDCVADARTTAAQVAGWLREQNSKGVS
ncbi:MAG: protoporphyrinogen oxidase [Acidobacteria bacterium]|nr:protoporphyrinogen oxidase [Acidobacteriota bacterium]